MGNSFDTTQNSQLNSNEKSVNHVISWSGGKDSTATILLFHEHENEILNPGDKVTILFAEVMFDKANNISGHNPDIIDFIYQKKKIFESWGYDVQILHANKDYLDIFYHKLKRSPNPKRVGKTWGFTPAGICAIKRDCKLKPINDWYKNNPGNIIQYVGIALDEPKRLESLKKIDNTVSLLERYGYTENAAMELCKKHDMLSPQYFLDKSLKRDGCWFCEHAKLCEHRAIKERYPEAWAKYVSLEDEPNLGYTKWNRYTDETLHDRDKKIAEMEKQIQKEPQWEQLTINDWLLSITG